MGKARDGLAPGDANLGGRGGERGGPGRGPAWNCRRTALGRGRLRNLRAGGAGGGVLCKRKKKTSALARVPSQVREFVGIVVSCVYLSTLVSPSLKPTSRSLFLSGKKKKESYHCLWLRGLKRLKGAEGGRPLERQGTKCRRQVAKMIRKVLGRSSPKASSYCALSSLPVISRSPPS